MAMAGQSRDHEYFQNKYHEQVEQRAILLVQQLKTMLANLLTTDSNQDDQESMNPAQMEEPTYGTVKTTPSAGVSQLPEGFTMNQSFVDNIKAQLNRLMALAESVRYITNELNTSTNTTKGFYEINLNRLTRLWDEMQALRFKIGEYTSTPEVYGFQRAEYQQLAEEVSQWLYILANKVKDQAAAPSTPPAEINSTIRLPRLEIPKFDGNYLKWMEFHDLFFELIHQYDSIPDVQKLAYLKGNVEGEAARLIRHLPTTSSNYEVAWELLQLRYANKRIIVNNALQQLTDLSYIGASSPASAIKGFHDTLNRSMRTLTALKIDITSWDPILLHMVMQKMDRQLTMSYENQLQQPRDLQTIDDFLKFLEKRFLSLESVKPESAPPRNIKLRKAVTSITSTLKSTACDVCKEAKHPIYHCRKFRQDDLQARWKIVKEKKLCHNCLSPGHISQNCQGGTCRQCNKKHNTLLHDNLQPKSKDKVDAQAQRTSSASLKEKATSLISSNTTTPQNYVLLGTAQVLLRAKNGRQISCRAILDSGSQVNLITEKLVRKLGLNTRSTQLHIEGIGERTKEINRRLVVELGSRTSNYTTQIEALILNKIISDQPSQGIESSKWNIPEDIELADPSFNNPGPIDLLLGAEQYLQFLKNGKIDLNDGLPSIQNTVFGWVITGLIRDHSFTNAICGVYTNEDALDNILQSFWKLEELNSTERPLTLFERGCEEHFIQNVTQDANGRFIVRLPFIDPVTSLGESKEQAINRFFTLERKLDKIPEVRKAYCEFMEEYETLGHMTLIHERDITENHYFIPHHFVLRPSSSTTKLRVVFDASAKTTSGKSLNDLMHAGITVQSDLFSILLRFRLPRYVFTTDIEKMYRQILVGTQDQMFQLIVWRSNSKDELKYFKLNTVTYGTRAAPYLATKCLQQLAQKNMARFPAGSQCLKSDFYVDDGLTGSDNLYEAIIIQSQLKDILKGAGFNLRKWCANHPKLLEGIPQADQEVSLDLREDLADSIKTLGIKWKPKTDKFCFHTNVKQGNKITKRIVTSEMAQMFDPLGLMAPVVVKAKIFVQSLWKRELPWDQELPSDLQEYWKRFRNDLASLNAVTVERHVFNHHEVKEAEIHTFADASSLAYGAAVYLRAELKNGCISVRLLCSKSRVAPIQQESIPRLELQAALLGAQLTSRVKQDLKYESVRSYLWSDSRAVLGQICGKHTSPEIFIANRVSKIQKLTLPQQWNYVETENNPADVVSRGLWPHQLKDAHLWFYGPKILYHPTKSWPNLNHQQLEAEFKVVSATSTSMPLFKGTDEHIFSKIDSRNNFRTLQRIVGYVYRFIRNTRMKADQRSTDKELSAWELHQSLESIIKWIQRAEFKEYEMLEKRQELPKTSPLSSLDAKMDSKGIIRLEGRIKNASLPHDAKHQMIAPYNNPVIKLYMEMIHQTNSHCPQAQLVYLTRQHLWPLQAKVMARSVIAHCVKCTRAKPKLLCQKMGNLPAHRVQQARPFLNSGVDYCGPFWIRSNIRGKRPRKSYIAIFCCFTTKAVHIEVVSDLTTEAFINALKRFWARRGHCQNLYSDNATNFVGAKNALSELSDTILGKEAQSSIQRSCSEKGIQFHVIPPRAPHFGGLWEAAVKSAKFLMYRNLSTASLTYEELETAMIEIEAILNSRPITPMSNDPNDLEALTPGHFLIGEPMVASPSQISASTKGSLRQNLNASLERREHFWKRWHLEYLNQLQQRYKWKKPHQNLTEGTLVIIKEDNSAPLQWPLGRIIKIYTGDDGHVRVADIKTQNGICKRAVHSLAPLFPDEVQESTLQTTPMEKPRPDEADEHSTKRRKMSIQPNLLLAVVALVLLPLVLCSSITQQKFPNKPGLYFEGIGTVHRVVGEWKLITYFDLNPIRREIELFRNGTSVLQEMCPHLIQQQMCLEVVEKLHTINTQLQSEEKLIKRRVTRGAIDFVGNIANKLFGVLDSEYAEQVSKTINQLYGNDDMLLKMIQNQTSIIDSTMNIIKREAEVIPVKINKLQEELNNISKIDVNLETYVSASIQLSLMAADIQRTEDAIFDVLTDARHGRISPLLLSPQQLQQEITKIKGHLPKNLHLPLNQNDAIHVYSLMSSQSGVSSHHIIFIITLPLTDNEEFDLFKLTPIPATVNDTMLYIRPETSFLAVTPHRDQYFALTQQELQECTPIRQTSRELLCSDKTSKFHQGAQAFSCELSMLKNRTDENCMFSELKSAVTWSPLHHTNQWIFTSTHDTQITAVCNGSTQLLELQGPNLLTLQDDCILKHYSATIQAHQTYTDTIYQSHIAFGDLGSINKSEARLIFNGSPLDLSNELQQLKQLHQALNKDKFIELPERVLNNNIHHSITSYSALLLIIILILWLTWKLKQMKQRGTIHSRETATATSQKPSPANRKIRPANRDTRRFVLNPVHEESGII